MSVQDKRAARYWHQSGVKLVMAIVAVLTAWLFVEQELIRRFPAWFARLGFFRLGPERRVASGAKVEWPAAFEQDGVEVAPPSGDQPGWMRIRAETGRSKRLAGVARIDAREHEGGTSIALRFFPAVLLWAMGLVVLLIAVILTLSPTVSGVVISAVSIGFWLVPVWNMIARARSRAAPALDALVAKLEAPPAPTSSKRGKRKR